MDLRCAESEAMIRTKAPDVKGVLCWFVVLVWQLICWISLLAFFVGLVLCIPW